MKAFVVLISLFTVISSFGIIQINEAEMTTSSITSLLTTDQYSISFSGGDGTNSNPFQISNITQLQNVTNNLTAHYVLINDIDASESKNWNNESGFIPIANDTNPNDGSFSGRSFKGYFNGKGHKITNLSINRSREDFIGLFGYVGTDGVVLNVSLIDVHLKGRNNVGAISGTLHGYSENCNVSGSVKGSLRVGGLIGHVGSNGNVETCQSDNCSISGSNYTGGVAGLLDGTMTYSKSYSDISGNYAVGGLAGFTGDYSIMRSCLATCNISGTMTIGGLVGSCGGKIWDSNSSGQIRGSRNVGGLAGITDIFGIVRRCNSDCMVNGTSSTGGLVGESYGKLFDCHSVSNVIGGKGSGYIGGAFGVSKGRGVLNCSARGEVRGGGGDIGGFSGINSDSLTGCFASGDVFSLSKPSGYTVGAYTGGFVGRTTGGTIRNCFSSGDVYGYNHLGGFGGINGYSFGSGTIINSYSIGKVYPSENTDSAGFLCRNYSGKVERCFFINESPEVDDPVGVGSFSYISPLSIYQMVNDSYYSDWNWDMTQVWNISNGFTSPFLLWQSNNPPKITTLDQTIATTNATYYFDYGAEDPDPTDILPEWSLITNADWLNLDENRTLSGMPGATDLGPYYANISIYDGRSGIDWHNFTLKINTSNNAPFILTRNDLFADEDFYYSNQYHCKVDEGDDPEWVVNTNASFLDISGDNGLLHGTPLVEDIGQFLINISVHDGQGAVEWTEFNLIVNETNDNPIILTKNIEYSWETFWYGNLYEAYDEENDELNWTLTTNASWLDINRTSGFLKGYPDQGDGGTYFVNITLGDIRGGSSWTNFTLTIYPTIGSGNQTDPVRIWNTTHFRMIELDLDRNYRMINDINASVTRKLNGGKGIVPIGGRFSPFTNTTRNYFSGTFDGNGYNITNLWINRPGEDYAGLFHFMTYSSSIKDLNMYNITVIGGERVGAISGGFYGTDAKNLIIEGYIKGEDYTGGLFGYLKGTVNKCNFHGQVKGSWNTGGITGHNIGKILNTRFDCDVSGFAAVGGLVGTQGGNALNNCSGKGNITGGDETGGLIGLDQDGHLTNCHFSGNVKGAKKVGGLVGKHTGFYYSGSPVGQISLSSSHAEVEGNDYVGGLVGQSSGKVIDTFSIGNTTGNNYCGGLIGFTDDKTETSYSTGNVSGSHDNVGGLIGKTTGQTYKCYATGNAIGRDYVGGLCGRSENTVEQSFSYGYVSGNWYSGGLIGYADGDVKYCFSTSTTTGSSRVGGLIGMSYTNSITNCYSIGKVTGGWMTGGLVARYGSTTCTNSFWDIESSGQNESEKGTGLTTLEMIDSKTYIDARWDMEYRWNNAHNMSYPFLRWKSFNSPPVIKLNGTFNATEDMLYTLQFERFDPDIIDVKGRWNINSNATWITIDIAKGKIEGTPENDDVGTYWINFSLEDGRGGSDAINVTLIVNNVNDNPILIGNHTFIALEDELYESFYTPFDVDPTNDELNFSIETNATWLGFESEIGRIFGTPEQDDIGIYWVNLSLDDGVGGTYWTRFEIKVQNTNDAPYFIIQEFPDAIEDESYELIVEADDIDPTNDRITWEINETNLDLLRINKYSGLITFEPGNDDVGDYWVKISISDGKGGYASKNFTFSIINVNDDPVIFDVQDQYVTEDVEFFIQLEGYDIDSDPVQFQWEMDTISSFVEFDQETGNITGLPLNDDIGEWDVEVTLFDGDGGESVTSFRIIVGGINDPPIVSQSIIEISFEENSDGTTIDINEYAYDEEGDDLHFFFDNSPNLTISNEGGDLSISPKQDYAGMDEIIVEVHDGSSSVYITLKIEVFAKNDPPVIIEIIIPETANDNETIHISCTTEDLEEDALTFKWTSNISGELGDLSELNTKLVAGLHNITLTVADGNGGVVERSFEIFVENTSPTTPKDDTKPDETNEKNPIILILGIILLVVLLMIIGVILYFRVTKKEDNGNPEGEDNKNQLSSSTISPPSSFVGQPNKVEDNKQSAAHQQESINKQPNQPSF